MNLVLALVLAQLAGAPAYPAPPVTSPPPPPPAATMGVPVVLQPTPVRFAARADGMPYFVEAQPLPPLQSFQPPQSCRAPCELRLVPGRYRMTVHGKASFKQKLRVRSEPTELQLEIREESWKRLGVASAAVGGGMALAGGCLLLASTMAAAMGDPADPQQPNPHWARTRNQMIGALAAIVVGGSIAGVGAGVGFRKMGSTRLAPRKAPGVELVGVAMGPTEGRGAQLGAAFRF